MGRVTRFDLDLEDRPEGVDQDKTYTEAQRICLQELYETDNPHAVLDFLTRLAIVVACDTHAREFEVEASNESMDIEFRFRMSDAGMAKVEKVRENKKSEPESDEDAPGVPTLFEKDGV